MPIYIGGHIKVLSDMKVTSEKRPDLKNKYSGFVIIV